MQLKSLQIQGFKSFPDKTTLVFGNGLTSVVGPNGSGKSNISDAVRWVMGEQSTKNLRGEKMEDVIFLGTQNRKPTGFAMVALTIDNSDRQLPVDADDVTISRKLYRSGESEYRINKTAVRLRDINELFMDTGLGRDGYSIIGQGRIEEIVSAKSNQRREIFEEAAGISKYRYRKAEAEKRLESAYENLLRLKDIMAELEGRVGPLREQSEKAQAFLKLSEEKKTVEVSLWVDGTDRSKELIREQEEKRIIAKNRQSDIQAVLDEYQCKLEEGYERMQQCSVEIETVRHRMAEQKGELSQCDSDVAVLNNDIAHNSETVKQIQEDVLRYAQSKALTQQRLEEGTRNMEEKRAQAAQLEEEQRNLTAGLEQSVQQYDQLTKEIASLKAQRAAFEQNIALQKLNKVSSSTLIEETAQRLETLTASQTDREETVRTRQEELAQCSELLEDIDKQILSLENTRSGYLLKQGRRQEEQRALEAQRRQLESQQSASRQRAHILAEMERNLEGYYNSVKHVMSMAQRGRLAGICGPVSQLISTPGEYRIAIETALGSALQHIVVEDEGAAKQAIQNLKFSKAGRATFLPISVLRPQSLHAPGIEQEEGYLGTADRLVSCDERYRAILQNQLGRVAVAEDIDCAVRIAKRFGYKFRVVTLDGQLVNAGGSLTGGSAVKNNGILSRREEIESLNREARDIERQIAALQPRSAALEEEAQREAALLGELEERLKVTQEDRITYASERKRLELACEDAAKAYRETRQEQQQIQRKLEELETSSVSAADLIENITRELGEVCRQIEEKKGLSETMSSLKQQAQEAMNNKRFDLLAVTKDLQALELTIQQLRGVHEEQRQQADTAAQRIGALQQSTAALEERIRQRLQRKKFLLEEVSRGERLIQEKLKEREGLEQQLNQIRGAEKEMIAQKERASAELTRVEEKQFALQQEYDKMIARLWDEYSLTRSQAVEIAVEVEDEQGMKNRLQELKNKIRALGNVNVAAIEEYREVHERYSFLKTQMEDVEQSRNELVRLIRELTQQMRELFGQSFQEINENFKQIFEELFMGGRGELVLTDPENVLESGIEINVQPPGKIIKTLASLSGGEKAFVAIAIYFSILKVRPAPFCMLDEIEAALDDVNVTRYARYLRKLSDKTQFISITHRRGTMEEADVMYGVTMQEKGVSRLLELDITQVESKLGMKA